MANCGYQAIEKVNILQGNSVILRLILCAGGQPVTNLGSAISATFQAMRRCDGSIGVTKNLGSMSIDDPEVGVVSIPLNSNETGAMDGEYDVSIEFSWGPPNSLEWKFNKTLNVIRDMISYP